MYQRSLFDIGSIDNAPSGPKLEKLGIYFSRYAELLLFSVREVIDRSTVGPFIEWFKGKANEVFGASKSNNTHFV